jgi:hypothetical protein
MAIIIPPPSQTPVTNTTQQSGEGGKPSIPHLDAPFTLTSAGAAVVDQNTPAEIEACVNNIVACPVGFRSESPNFGIPSPQFTNAPVPVTGIEQAIQLREPRAEPHITEYADASGDQERHLSIDLHSGNSDD